MGAQSNHSAHAAAMAALAAALLAAAQGATTRPASAQPPSTACSLTTKDFSNQTLSWCNFSGRDLTNAKFSGATLTGVVFIRAKLAGADFSNAVFADSKNAVLPNDFTLADLTNAVFRAAKFQGLTYFTYATVTCADFSQTDISNGNPVFGIAPLGYQPGATCATAPNRVKFQGTRMNCEFIDDWRNFDLTGADVSACLTRLAGRDFSGAMLGGVKLNHAILDGAKFTNAQLQKAVLTGASLQCRPPGSCVDLTSAQLQGANLDNANLTGASLYRAYLSNLDGGAAGTLIQAHLKNVNLSYAQLSGVDFTSANFYGNNPAGLFTDNPARRIGCATTGPDHSGFTNSCASAFQATMVGTRFLNAYLYGVDFGTATISGVSFENTVLVGVDFSAAKIGVNPSSSAATTFRGAYLQGTDLNAASAASADLSNAYVDFRPSGNEIYINLSGATHNAFACSTPSTCKPASGQDVCVWVRYPVTTVPAGNSTMTCPDGSQGPCGAADPGGGNAQWKSKWDVGAPPQGGPPPGWYSNAATYTPAAPDSAICNGKGSSGRTIFW